MMILNGCVDMNWILKYPAAGSSNRFEFPLEKGNYSIGVRSLLFTEHEETPDKFAILCVLSPTCNSNKTYLPDNKVFTSLCQYSTHIKQNGCIYVNLSNNMTYHTVSFQTTSVLSLQIIDIFGEPIKAAGIFDLHILCKK